MIFVCGIFVIPKKLNETKSVICPLSLDEGLDISDFSFIAYREKASSEGKISEVV